MKKTCLFCSISKFSDIAYKKGESELSECYTADESALEDTINDIPSEASQNTQESLNVEKTVKVLKKRGRKKKVKPTSLSPVKEASNSRTTAFEKQKIIESEVGQSQKSFISQESDLETMSGVEVQKEEEQQQENSGAPSRETEEASAEQTHDLDCAAEVINVEKETLNLNEQGKLWVASSSSIHESLDEETNVPNSCDDLFESCPKTTKDIPEGGANRTSQDETKSRKASDKMIKRSLRLSKKKLSLGKLKCPSLDCEEDSDEDDVPLAQIKHCYLDVESQKSSDSEVDFPKKKLEADWVKESSKVIVNKGIESKETETTEQLTNLKTKRTGRRLSANCTRIGPKTSPNSAFAKKALRRAIKSPLNCNKSSPRKPVIKVAAKVSPMATRLHTSKRLSSSFPSKPSRKPRRVLKVGTGNDDAKPAKRSTFEEKLDKALNWKKY